MALTFGARVLAVKIIFTAVIFFSIFSNIELKNLLITIRSTNLFWLAAAVIFYGMTFVVGGIRWHGINNIFGNGPNLFFCIRIFFIGGFFSQFMVGGGYGGDVYRVWALARCTGQRLNSFSTVFIDRISGLVGVAFTIACLAPIYCLIFPDHKQILIAVSIGCAFGIAILVLLAWMGKDPRFNGWNNVGAQPIFLRIHEVSRNLGKGFLMWPVARVHIGWSLVALLFNMLALSAIGSALSITIDFWVYLVLGPIIFLAKSFPLSFAGWGAREAAMVYFFGLVNVDIASAIAMSIIAGVLVLVATIPGGILWLSNKDLKSTDSNFKKLAL